MEKVLGIVLSLEERNSFIHRDCNVDMSSKIWNETD